RRVCLYVSSETKARFRESTSGSWQASRAMPAGLYNKPYLAFGRSPHVRGLFPERSHRAKFFVTAGDQVVGIDTRQLAELALERSREAFRHSGRIVLGAAFRLGNDFIDQVMFLEVFGSELQ